MPAARTFFVGKPSWFFAILAAGVSVALINHSSCAAGFETGGSSTFAPTGVNGNFVQNGGFETPSTTDSALPLAWVRDLGATNGKGTASRTENNSRVGSAALLLEPTRRNDATHPLGVAQEIPAENLLGSQVQLSADLRTEGEAAAAVGIMSVANGVSSPFTMVYQPANTDWNSHSTSFRVPNAANTKLYVSIWTVGQSGAALFDNVAVTIADDPSIMVSANNAATPGGPIDAAREPAFSASIAVNAAALGRFVPDELYGANIEWRWNATGLWDVERDEVDPNGERLADEMGVTLIRYPGGIYSDYYRWAEGIGPREDRPMQTHEPGKLDKSVANFGTDEVLAFADRIGAEVMITVNMITGTAEEAADWVRYVNGDQLRVRFWEIGNEQYINNGTPTADHATLTPQQYANRALIFANAMKAADPRIKIGLVGGLNEGNYRQMDYEDWNEIVYQKAGSVIDFISIHNAYAPVLTGDEQDRSMRDVYSAMMSRPLAIANNLARTQAQLEAFFPEPDERPFIAVTEWGPIFQFFNSGNYVDHPKTLGSAVFSASTLKTLIEAENTRLAAFWMLNDFGVLGWISSRSSAFPPNPEWTPTPRFYAFKLFARHFGDRLVQTDVVSPTFDAPQVGWSGPMDGVPYVEAISSLDVDGRLHVIVINKHFDAPVNVAISIAGYEPDSSIIRHQLSGTALDAHTGTRVIQTPFFEWGEQVTDARYSRFEESTPADVTLTSTHATLPSDNIYYFPPHSVTSLEFRSAGAGSRQ